MLQVVASNPTRGRPKGSVTKAKILSELPTEPKVAESDAEIDARISKTFKVLDKVNRGVIAGQIRGTIISGATGCGKTFSVERDMTYAMSEDKIEFVSHKGTTSAITLFQYLHDCSEPRKILCLDDNDSIFYDMESLNLLKAALDTQRNRRITWGKESWVLQKYGLPHEFEFRGACMFVSNIDFTTEIERGTKIAKHLQALMGRCLYIDLGIHSKKEILIRIRQVINGGSFFEDHGISYEMGETIKKWLDKNFTRVQSLSIRTAVNLAALIKSDPRDWEDTAEVVLCKR